jgi:hypothetical protein
MRSTRAARDGSHQFQRPGRTTAAGGQHTADERGVEQNAAAQSGGEHLSFGSGTGAHGDEREDDDRHLHVASHHSAGLASASQPAFWTLTAFGGAVLGLGILATSARAEVCAQLTAADLNPEALAAVAAPR